MTEKVPLVYCEGQCDVCGVPATTFRAEGGKIIRGCGEHSALEEIRWGYQDGTELRSDGAY